MRRPDPHTVINLRLILVSGKTKDFQFHPSESAGDIAQYVFDSWPSSEYKSSPAVDQSGRQMYSAIHPVIGKVFKIRIWGIPPCGPLL